MPPKLLAATTVSRTIFTIDHSGDPFDRVYYIQNIGEHNNLFKILLFGQYYCIENRSGFGFFTRGESGSFEGTS